MTFQDETLDDNPVALRKHLRALRRRLTPAQQAENAKKATLLLLRSRWLQRPKHIAVFLSQDGELATQDLIQTLWQRGHHVYLPVLKTLRGRAMAFAPFTPDTEFHFSKFGIAEPKTPQKLHRFGNQLEVIITPLVGFDETGGRLGMGGGFYDRTFAFKRDPKRTRPVLIGWAHDCQKVEKIAQQPWDVPLDAVVTEKKLYLPKKTNNRH